HRVGRGDGAVDVGIIDDGREEIHRLDDGDVVAHPVDGGIVALAQSHEEVRVALSLEPAQHVLEISRTHLGGSPRARRVTGEPDLLAARGIRQLAIHRREGPRVLSPTFDARATALDSRSLTRSRLRGRRGIAGPTGGPRPTPRAVTVFG